MKHASLFSGIGGFDLAAEWMGWNNVFHCEWMEFPRKVLEFYWPEADSYTDICDTNFEKYANQIDIITGGFPCQPFSLAGKRKGTEDERFLWKEMFRAIQEIKPKYVIAENVLGLTSIDGGLVLESVWSDLEAQGYEVQSFIIPAASKNAPHRRDRIWIVAHSSSIRFNTGRPEQSLSGNGSNGIEGITSHTHHTRTDFRMRSDRNGSKEDATNTKCSRRLQRSKNIQLQKPNGFKFIGNGRKRNATNTNSNGLNKCYGNDEINSNQGRQYAQRDIEQSNCNGDDTDSLYKGLQRGQEIDRWKKHKAKWRAKGIDIGADGKNYDGEITREFQKFPTQSPICGGDDGLPTQLDGITFPKWRAESIKGYGNAIVPQVAFEIFKVIQEIENQSI